MLPLEGSVRLQPSACRRGEEGDDQFVEFFYGPNGLNMMAFMLKREDGVRWPFDPIGLPVAPRVVKRAP